MAEDKTKRKGNAHWHKGMPSPNPGGRPKLIFPSRDLKDAIQKLVNPEDLARLALDTAKGEPLAYYVHPVTGRPTPCLAKDLPENADVTEYIKPTTAERMRAMEFLADRVGWKPPAAVDVKVTQGPIGPRVDYSRLSSEQLDKLIELTELAQATDEENPSVPALPPGREEK